jgi:hypothetical protein
MGIKEQPSAILLSSTKAEYVSVSAAICEALQLKAILKDTKLDVKGQ